MFLGNYLLLRVIVGCACVFILMSNESVVHGDEQLFEKILETLESRKKSIRGKRIEVTKKSSVLNVGGYPTSNKSLIFQCSENGDDWVYETTESRPSKLMPSQNDEFVSSIRYKWPTRFLFKSSRDIESIELEVGHVQTRDRLNLMYLEDWGDDYDPLVWVEVGWLFGLESTNGYWTVDLLKNHETKVVKRDGDLVEIEFTARHPHAPRGAAEAFVQYEIVFRENENALDLVAIESSRKQFHIETGEAVGYRSEKATYSGLEQSVISKKCNLEITESDLEKNLRIQVLWEYEITSMKKSQIPEKLFFEKISIPNGERIVSTDNVRYEYHDGEIFKMADDRTLESLEGVKLKQSNFWVRFRPFFIFVALLTLVVGFLWLRNKRLSSSN